MHLIWTARQAECLCRHYVTFYKDLSCSSCGQICNMHTEFEKQSRTSRSVGWTQTCKNLINKDTSKHKNSVNLSLLLWVWCKQTGHKDGQIMRRSASNLLCHLPSANLRSRRRSRGLAAAPSTQTVKTTKSRVVVRIVCFAFVDVSLMAKLKAITPLKPEERKTFCQNSSINAISQTTRKPSSNELL